MVHLILGGARSGKSSFAEQQVTALSECAQKPVTYLATATGLDEEMRQRIARHQQDRPAQWRTVEVPLALTETITELEGEQIVLVDCLTLWLNNQLYHYPDQDFRPCFEALVTALKQTPHDVFLVANEVGLGIIPIGQVSREFVDQAGWLNQAVAKVADEVSFLAAGLPITLKSPQAGKTPNDSQGATTP